MLAGVRALRRPSPSWPQELERRCLVGELTLDHQRTTLPCEHCGAEISVSRGSVYDDGQPCGLYLAGLHHCRGEPSAMLALAVRPRTGESPQAVHLQVRATSNSYEMLFVEPARSPWAHHAYLGRMLQPAEARESELRERFFHIAEHVIRDVPAVREYLAAT